MRAMSAWCCAAILVLALPLRADEGDPLAALPAEAWDHTTAAHLLRRAGFSGSPAEVAALAQLTLAEAVAQLVHYEELPSQPSWKIPPFDPTAPDTAKFIAAQTERTIKEMVATARQRMIADLESALAGSSAPRNAAASKRRGDGPRPNERYDDFIARMAHQQALSRARQNHERMAINQLREWWLTRMASSQRPLEEKMTLFWHGHFASGYETVGNTRHMLIQNELLRSQATGSFRELVHRIARDPAMLRYLDGNRNVKGKPNENFARELMELFTLGRDQGYTEADIKEAARAFTGWTYRGENYAFNAKQHDDGAKVFMGRKGKLNGDDVIETILAQEQCARFICGKLVRFFCGEPDDVLAQALAAVLRKHDYQLKPVLVSLFSSRTFYASLGRGVKSPVELVVGMVRELELPASVAGQAAREIARMGQDLFQPPNVKGWDGGTVWINSATLLVRYNAAREAIVQAPKLLARAAASAQPGQMGEAMMEPAQEEVRQRKRQEEGGKGERRKEDRAKADRQAIQQALANWPLQRTVTELGHPTAVVDHLIARLFARPIEAAVREQLLHSLTAGNDAAKKFESKRLETLLVLMTSLPEYQLN